MTLGLPEYGAVYGQAVHAGSRGPVVATPKAGLSTPPLTAPPLTATDPAEALTCPGLAVSGSDSRREERTVYRNGGDIPASSSLPARAAVAAVINSSERTRVSALKFTNVRW